MRVMNAVRRLLPQSNLRRTLSASTAVLQDLRRRQIRFVQIYTTNRCNSRCLHCNIWQYTEKRDLPVDVIANLLEAHCLDRNAQICLEGGEFTLHPDYKEILGLFGQRQVRLNTNGILTGRLVEIAERFNNAEIMVSLEGNRETYRRLRGVDAYENVIETIRLLKDKVKVIVGFTFTPWNGASDYLHVSELCKEYGVELGVPNLYTNQPYFKTDEPPAFMKDKYEMVKTQDTFQKRCLEYHDGWLRGEVVLPCFTIFRTGIIYPEGDVYFCHHRRRILGNLHEETLDQIWNSKRSRNLQDEHLYCNKCWCVYHRLPDVYVEPLGKMFLLSRRIRERMSRGL